MAVVTARGAAPWSGPGSLGGESAGGGLAASLAHRVHDTGETPPVAQWLFCPMLDDRTAARKDLDAVGHFVWNNRLNRFGWRSYLGSNPAPPAFQPTRFPLGVKTCAGYRPHGLALAISTSSMKRTRRMRGVCKQQA